ncbi:MAG TPA: hypothetical protein VFO34_07755 [Candidatus Acidoferrales bacterium]|nr:hypothetical protein [Candidatus Acidoferrales bacterium]
MTDENQGTPASATGAGKESGRQFGLALLAGLIVVLIIGGVAYWMSRGSGATPGAPSPLPMGTAEQAYAPKIQFSDFELTRATNMLKMETTNVRGTFANMGERSVAEMEISLGFEDLSKQIIFTDSRRLLGQAVSPLAAGESRRFELSFENIPAGWDQTPPKITITGLRLK